MEEITFKKITGMACVLTKKLSECTEDEVKYRHAYQKHMYRLKREKHPNKTKEYNSKYCKQYYQMNKEKLQTRARLRKQGLRTGNPIGRPNLSGIVVE